MMSEYVPDCSKFGIRPADARGQVCSRTTRGREILAGSYRSVAPQMDGTQSSKAPDATAGCRIFQVTHPFHPLSGREFELLNVTRCCGDERVFYVDATDEVRSVPARWQFSPPPVRVKPNLDKIVLRKGALVDFMHPERLARL